MKLSICIPTYNRAKHLLNCLSSIEAADSKYNSEIEYCISDNASTDETKEVVDRFKDRLNIKYYRNEQNLGMSRNFIKSIQMAEGEFIWMIGDDDLVMPDAFREIGQLIVKNPDVDFFYINAYHLTVEYVFNFPQPFEISNIPPVEKMTPFSSYDRTGKLPFYQLINPKVSFDFLGGIFLSVFRREMWLKNQHVLCSTALSDINVFSHFDNTFPHLKVYANAFMSSQAFYYQKPLSICLTGAREWSPMYPLVHSVRLVEALEEYRKNGMSLTQYLYCRNFALNNFIPDLAAMFVYRESSGYQYINPLTLYLKNAGYPNTYFSILRFIVRKLSNLFKKTSPALP